MFDSPKMLPISRGRSPQNHTSKTMKVLWSLQEAAYLLRALINVLEHGADRRTVVSEVSQNLRRYGELNGVTVDAKYRNESGIDLQMSNLEYVYTNGKSGLVVKTKTGWLFDIVDIYRHDQERYQSLLREIDEKLQPHTELKFEDWLEQKHKKEKKQVLTNLNLLSMLLTKDRFLNVKILEVPIPTVIQDLIDDIRRRHIDIHSVSQRNAYLRALTFYEEYLEEVNPHETESDAPIVIEDQQEVHGPKVAPDSNVEQKGPASAEVISYLDWLQRKKGLALSSSKIYWGKVRQLDSYAVDQGYASFLSISDPSEAQTAIQNLLSSADVREQIQRAKPPMDRYLEYLEFLKTGGNLEQADSDAQIENKQDSSDVQGEVTSAPDNGKYEYKHTSVETITFADWLQQEKGLALSSSRVYRSKVRQLDSFAVDQGYASFLSISDPSEAQIAIRNFLSSTDVDAQVSRGKSILELYLEYLEFVKTDARLVHAISSVLIQQKQASPDVQETISPALDYGKYEQVLRKHFPRGIRKTSTIDRMKFRRYWSQDYGEDFPGDEKAIQRALSKITVPFNDFEYLPEMLMDKQTADDINRYLDECKKQGISLVTYDALFDKYRDRFDETSMSDAGMLQAYLEHANSDKYYCERNGVVFDRMKTANPADDVRQYLIRSGKPVLFETMCREMPYLDKTMINRVLTGTNSAEFIRNQGSNEKKEYFHADIVNVTEDEMASVVVLIETAIQKHRYISGIEFMDALSNQIPDLVERYPQITPYGWRETFAYKLHGVFSFNGPVISSLQDNFSTSDVYSYFAKSQDRFTLAQLNDLSESLATPIYFDSIYENALRISEEEFVSRKYANFDCDAIDSVLDRFCEGDFIPISHVNIFGSFPDVGFAWNSFLLQHYVADFSKKYCLICNGYTADRAVGTIVKRSSSLSNLEDVLARALAESDVDLTQSAALDFFVEEGYIGRRRLTSINQVMIRANNIRMAKN